MIGGTPLATLGRSAFNLDISITDETNTKAEKARYVQEVFAAMAALRPDLHEVSYVHLIDARAAAYGYDGRTGIPPPARRRMTHDSEPTQSNVNV